MKKVILLLFAAVAAASGYASHFTGGELRYEFNGSNYTIKLALYGKCASTSAPLPTSAMVSISSVAGSSSIPLTLNLVNFDTVDVGCPTMPNSCYVPSNPIPGYVIGNYSASVTLPSQQTDWLIQFSSSARAALNNISSVSASFYLEATLNNSTAINSSPWVPNKPNYFAIVNQPLHIPMQILDPEGDSTAYELVPAMTAAGTNVTYSTGMSALAPFGTGGICSFGANNVLTVKGTSLGMYAVNIKVKDYRNGVLVGTYMREITIAVMSGTGNITLPMPTPTSVFTVFTCPGQTNGVTVNFMDSTATDSVFVAIWTPTITGWTFSPAATFGLASGSATINWTTPASLNPATLPFFFIHIRARDKNCPRGVSDFSILVRTRQCLADSVWPGDANGDFTVNIYDPLAIAIANGKTGATRTGATTSWIAQACTNWGTTLITNNTDIKHADCNGDGTVNSTDLGAVTSNWGSWHLKGGSQHKTTGAPDIYLDLNAVTLEPGKTVNIPIKLGSSASSMTDFYGLATLISISGMMPDVKPVINTSSSWLGNSGNTLNFSHSATNDAIYWAYARTDQQNASGQGNIGFITVKVPATMKAGDKVDFSVSMSKLIDKDGREKTAFNETTTTGVVQNASGVGNVAGVLNYMTVVPNPSASNAELRFGMDKQANVNIEVTDLLGKTVWQYTAVYSNGSQVLSLPSELPAGLYMVQMQTEQSAPQLIKWIKQ
jgi:hypothetical protein